MNWFEENWKNGSNIIIIIKFYFSNSISSRKIVLLFLLCCQLWPIVLVWARVIFQLMQQNHFWVAFLFVLVPLSSFFCLLLPVSSSWPPPTAWPSYFRLPSRAGPCSYCLRTRPWHWRTWAQAQQASTDQQWWHSSCTPWKS